MTRAPFKPDRKQPSKAAKKRVKSLFDPDALAKICTLDDFSEYAPRYDIGDDRFGLERFFHYKDNGSQILAVAHLDTVQKDGTCRIIDTAAGLLVTSGKLDDRLGAYVILDLLPKMGINCDILLTTNEEMAQSTARYFDPPKDYNWMIEFDRGGTDVVMYQYESDDMVKLVEECGARVGTGSYSDIADLDDLEVVGFNWGVGYQEYHSARSHAWLEDTFRMVARFEKFYNANAERYLPFEYPEIDLEGEWKGPLAWDDHWTFVADCGHEVNGADTDSFIDMLDNKTICRACGTAA